MRMWTYKGINVYPAGHNSSGIRWTANANVGATLKSDTKDGMKELINNALKIGGYNPRRRSRRNYWPKAPRRHKWAAKKGWRRYKRRRR